MSKKRQKICECGCNTEFTASAIEVKYIRGHQWLGKKVSEETKEKLRKPRSEETKQRMKASFTDERKFIISERLKGDKNPAHKQEVKNKKAITCIKKYGVDNYAKTEEFKIWISDNNAMNNPIHKQKIIDYNNLPEIKLKNSEALKNKNHPIHSIASLEKRLKTMAGIKALGGYRVTAIWKTGWFVKNDGTQEWFDSSYEETKMKELENQNLIWTKKHGIRIPFVNSKNINSYYVPDFLIIDEFGNKTIEEIKGYIVENSEDKKEQNQILKLYAGQKYCQENSFNYNVYIGKDFILTQKYSFTVGN